MDNVSIIVGFIPMEQKLPRSSVSSLLHLESKVKLFGYEHKSKSQSWKKFSAFLLKYK